MPYFDKRIRYGYDQFGSRTADEGYGALLKSMAKHPGEYFRMFYGDTAVNGSASAIRCGLDFFGPKRVMFGTDCPFDPQGGPLFIRESIKGSTRSSSRATTGTGSTSATRCGCCGSRCRPLSRRSP